MSYLSETRDEIKLTSPSGKIFTGLWKGDSRSGEKKLGTYSIPNLNGDIIQDMGSKSTTYPLTIYFEGAFHYQTATDFFDTMSDEKGQWEIIHPTKGTLILQLVGFTENINPVEDGNYTSISTNWLEPANIERIISIEETSMQTLVAVLTAIQDGIIQAQQLRTDAYAAVQATISTMSKIAGFVDSVLEEIAMTDAIINDAWSNAKSSFDQAILSFQNDSSNAQNQEDMMSDFVDIITLPLESSDEYNARMSAYKTLNDSIILLTPENSNIEDYNKALSQEFGLIVIFGAICRIILTSNFKTRVETVNAMESLTDTFNLILETLENVQTQFDDLDIDKQFFSQSKGYSSLQDLFSLTIKYLISQFFNLSAEKRFTLKKPRSPIEITVTEYGDITNYDLFLESNNLTGDEILILPTGKEVVIYV